jgi:DNA uptake protein ComE-like DNA-binding protein
MRSHLQQLQEAGNSPKRQDFRIFLLVLLCLGILVSHWVLPGRADRQATPPENTYHLRVVDDVLKLRPGSNPFTADAELPARLTPFFFKKIPVNEADSELLQIIPGIGPELAARIIAAGSTSGGFSSAEQLLSVPGIGERRKEKLDAWLSFE